MLSVAERNKYILDKLNKHGFIRITDDGINKEMREIIESTGIELIIA